MERRLHRPTNVGNMDHIGKAGGDVRTELLDCDSLSQDSRQVMRSKRADNLLMFHMMPPMACERVLDEKTSACARSHLYISNYWTGRHPYLAKWIRPDRMTRRATEPINNTTAHIGATCKSVSGRQRFGEDCRSARNLSGYNSIPWPK